MKNNVVVSGPENFGVHTLLADRSAALASTTPLEAPIVVHGDVQRFAAFTHVPALKSALTAIDAWDGAEKTARAWSPVQGPEYEIFATRGQIRPLYDAGCTIVLEDVERYVPELRPLCRALEHDLGIPMGRVNAEVFCSRAEGCGRPHFDPSFTFNCQVEGIKTWRLGPNDAVRFPPAGMFLGRVPPAELSSLVTKPIPANLTAADTVVAKPGTVVFLPPGVLHETRTETGSYAIAFAIEHTETLGKRIAEEVRLNLQNVPSLRAARLGAQLSDVGEENRLAADVLRRMAAEIESRNWVGTEELFRLRDGLSAEPVDATHIILHGGKVARTFSLDEVPVLILGWASARGAFTLRNLAMGLPMIDADLIQPYVRQLLHLGLMQQEK